MKTVLVGLDVSADKLDVSIDRGEGTTQRGCFANTVAGFRALWKWVARARDAQVRACLEATGTYGIEIGRFLVDSGAEVMMVNPRAMRDFAKASLERSKTDAVDSDVALEYSRRMKFVAWTPPKQEYWQLRECSRRAGVLVKMRTEEKNRLHAAARVHGQSSAVRLQIGRHIKMLDKEIALIRQTALEMIREDAELFRRYKLIRTIKGFGDVTAIVMVAELAMLAPDLDARQWVAFVGIDPRQYESGKSVRKQPRISRMGNAYLRHALYMPCLSAMRSIPQVRAFADVLIGRGKAPKQAVIAVMRKMIHAIWGMLQNNTSFDATRFYRGERRQRTLEQPPIVAVAVAGDGLVKATGGRQAEALDKPSSATKSIDRRLLVARLAQRYRRRLFA